MTSSQAASTSLGQFQLRWALRGSDWLEPSSVSADCLIAAFRVSQAIRKVNGDWLLGQRAHKVTNKNGYIHDPLNNLST